MKYKFKKVLKMGHPTNHLLFSHFDEANEKLRNFNENIKLPISQDISHFFTWEKQQTDLIVLTNCLKGAQLWQIVEGAYLGQ